MDTLRVYEEVWNVSVLLEVGNFMETIKKFVGFVDLHNLAGRSF